MSFVQIQSTVKVLSNGRDRPKQMLQVQIRLLLILAAISSAFVFLQILGWLQHKIKVPQYYDIYSKTRLTDSILPLPKGLINKQFCFLRYI